MFTISDRRHNRRQFLKIGGLSLGGLSLADLLAQRARASESGRMNRDKSVVMLFLQGGPSQIETFDPKMTAPQEIRSITGEIRTNLPGVTFGGHFRQLAARADRLAVVRSFASLNGDHQNYLSVAGGSDLTKAPMGTVYARVAGPNHPQTGIPTNVLITPEAVGDGLRLGQNFETQSLQKLVASSQSMGASYCYFDPSSGNELRRNLDLSISRDRFNDRRSLLREFDAVRRQIDINGLLDSVSSYEQQAFDILARGIGQAFDLTREDPRVIARYDTSRLFDLETVTRWGDMRRSSNLLGRQLLLARRLVEAGCGFVTVVDAGWDMHSNGNSPVNLGGMNWLGPQVDHAVAAFLDDLRARGLEEKVLLVVTGEFGRTPRINRNGGRDHWANLTPLVLAGGGLKMGQVIGQSDRQAGTPATTPYHPSHLFATVMHTLFDPGLLRVNRDVPKSIVDAVGATTPITELF
jgi:hypothetical protein